LFFGLCFEPGARLIVCVRPPWGGRRSSSSTVGSSTCLQAPSSTHRHTHAQAHTYQHAWKHPLSSSLAWSVVIYPMPVLCFSSDVGFVLLFVVTCDDVSSSW
jgi:hypothetical protein